MAPTSGRGLRLARSMLLPVRRFGEEEFAGQGGRLLLAGNALHADFAPEAAGSGGFGWLMSMLGQSYGFPVPAGGSSALTSALVRRLSARGAAVHCGQRVTEVVVRRGRAVGVRTAQGGAITARNAVLADVSAPALYQELVGAEHLPPRIFDDLRRFQWDFATFKVDWALDGPVPWSAQGLVRPAPSIWPRVWTNSPGLLHRLRWVEFLTAHLPWWAR